MKVFLLLALLSCFAYRCALAQQICGCSGVRHPQVRYCDADFAALIQIHDKVEADLPFTEPSPYGITDYMRYNISVLEVFKPKEVEVILVTEDFVNLWTSIASPFCGKSDLDILEEYVISGDFETVVDPATGEEYIYLEIDTCDLYLKLDDVSTYQMQAFTGQYDNYCGSECQPNNVFGEQEHNRFGEIDSQHLPVEALTKYWTLDIDCFYNPSASMHNLVDDCESKFSVCQSDPETHQCGWDLNSEFMECFKNRGLAVSYRRNPSNAAAIKKPSDCKYLPSKKLKKKCLRKLKRVYKQRLMKQRSIE